jgi:hypothetical protein
MAFRNLNELRRRFSRRRSHTNFAPAANPLSVPPRCIDAERQFLFVHIPKNAGTSIAGTFGFSETTHHTSAQLKELLGATFDRYFKAAVVRNPWDRFLSLYQYATAPESEYHSSTRPDKARFGKHLDFDTLNGASLRRCAELLVEGKLHHDQFWNHWQPQCEWLVGNSNEILVDHVGRVERIDEFVEFVSRRLGIASPPKLPRLNESRSHSREPFAYRAHFDPGTREIVGDYYRRDIALFGYEF